MMIDRLDHLRPQKLHLEIRILVRQSRSHENAEHKNGRRQATGAQVPAEDLRVIYPEKR